MSVNISLAFNANYYRSLHADLAEFEDEQALQHWQSFGIHENRTFSFLIDLDYYRSANADLQDFDNPTLLDHLLNFGISEGRSFSPVVDLSFYISMHSDLSAMSREEAFEHLVTFGINEERACSPNIDLNYYRSSYPDLANFSFTQAFEHLVAFGMNEARTYFPPSEDMEESAGLEAEETATLNTSNADNAESDTTSSGEGTTFLPELPDLTSDAGDTENGTDELGDIEDEIDDTGNLGDSGSEPGEPLQSAVPVEVEDPADTGETGDLSDPSEELPNPIPSLAFNWGDDPAILWRNYETGENQAWFMDGTETIGSAQLPPMSDWQWRLMGSANFNEDEYPDLLWRNSQTGENQIWLMGENDQGEIISSEIVELVGRDTNWQLRGIGDIDGNGSADILWHDLDYGQNQVWLMNGTQRSFTLNLPHMDDVSWDADSWDMRGTGDFNNDNRPDLIWRNTVTGANQIWLMNGLDCTETVNLEPLDDTNWQLMGSSDLNSDGISDLLWHNMTTGNNQVWLMDNTDQIEVQEVVELRSSDEMTGEMTLQNFFNGETVAQEVVDGEPVETLIPELEGIANLATSVGDGGLNITVDRVGSFGTAVHPLTYAYYDPVGSIHEASTTYRSSVAIRLGDTGERTFLNPNDSTSPDVTSSTPNSIYSEFSYEGLDFSLAQSVNKLFQDGDRTGSVLTQTYTMTNPGSETVNFELVRYIDGDLHFDGSIQDGGGRLLNDGQQILFETDAGGNPLAATTFVGITADGGTELDGNFEIDYWFDLKARILSGETLDNAIAGDGIDEDEFVDEAGEYDLALALGNGFELAPGESQTYTTTTIFGSGSPETSVTENDGSLVLQLADSQTDDTNEQPEGQSLTGSSDSDVLTGAEGNDTLSGVVADADTPGLGEIDTLTGGEGADLFVLGDSARFYYNDGDDAQPGVSDYALIADFDLSEDFIQLYGEPTDYQLGNAPEDLPAGTAIFKTTSGENELMAIVVDNSALSVEDDCFSFV